MRYGYIPRFFYTKKSNYKRIGRYKHTSRPSMIRYDRKNEENFLDSGYTIQQTMVCLDKNWLGYVIAKSHHNIEEMIMYAKFINKLEADLKRPLTEFQVLK